MSAKAKGQLKTKEKKTMGTRVIGKLDSWEDADLGGNDFMNLEEGSNPVRVFSKPYQFYVVWTVDQANQKRKIKTPVDGCPLVERGDTPQTRWYIGVLNRTTGKPSILEVGPQIFRQIVGLSKNKKWGDPKGYDVDIIRHKKGSQPLYTVTPEPHSDITAEEKAAIKEFMSRVDLVKMTEAPTPDEIREMVGLPSENNSTSSVDNDFDSDDSDDDINFDDDEF